MSIHESHFIYAGIPNREIYILISLISAGVCHEKQMNNFSFLDCLKLETSVTDILAA